MHERLRRWGFRAAIAGFVGIGAYYATFGGVYSAFDIRSMQQDRGVLQDSVFRLETVTDSLVQRGDSLVADPVAIERVAREEHGFLRDGEIRVRFVPRTDADAGRDGAGSAGVGAEDAGARGRSPAFGTELEAVAREPRGASGVQP